MKFYCNATHDLRTLDFNEGSKIYIAEMQHVKNNQSMPVWEVEEVTPWGVKNRWHINPKKTKSTDTYFYAVAQHFIHHWCNSQHSEISYIESKLNGRNG